MQIPNYDVLILGAGVIGNTLACSLAQGGLEVALIEATPLEAIDLNTTDLRTLAITHATEQLLSRVGVWSRIQRLTPFTKMEVWDSAGPGRIRFDSQLLHQSHLGYIIENKQLQAALIQQRSTLPNLTCYQPAQFEHFSVTKDQVLLNLNGGRILSARLLISAEGAESKVRAQAGIPYHLHDYAQQAIVATVETVLSHQYTAWQRFLPTGPLAFLPLPDPHHCAIVWSVDTPKAEQLLSLSSSEFEQELAEAFAFKLGGIQACSPRASFALRGRHAASYVLPRIALVGDAAHTIHPLAGQGANLGFLDVHVLSEVILEAASKRRDFGHYSTLRKYERQRKVHNQLMLNVMEGFKTAFSSPSLPLTWLRNAGLGFANEVPPLKKMLMYYAMGVSP